MPAIDAEGGLWAWGSGMVIDPAAGPAPVPVRIPMPGPVLAVSGTHAIVSEASSS